MATDAVATASATRGRTVIEARVQHRLVERAVLSVAGVVPRRTLVPGRTLPAITVGGGRNSADVDVRIDAAWPADSNTLIDSVRRSVIGELTTTVGETPARVNIRITRWESARSSAEVADAYATDSAPSGSADHESRCPAPRGFASSTAVGVLIAITFIAVGVIAIRDAVSAGPDWVAPVLNSVSQQHWQWWYWPAAVLAVVAGLVLLIAAVKPRRRTHVDIGDDVWVTRSAAKHFEGDFR